ncbi:LysR family transcriptional regulator [Lutimaribacter marinistellae]|uniref:LysR family transcriptional regulator n=1 Tax=Lutimaribacter marinistellae TaxID=1820329 RepID=A0ABV7THE6_9RHOB
MISLKDLEFLSALARRRHFARAAEDCGVSQPAFSMRIRKIEERLDTPIVRRGNRFLGFTAEGEALIRHARSIVEDVKAMEQEFRSAKGELTGRINIGVIPTAVVFAARVVNTVRQHHPGITFGLYTATSLAIQQGIENGSYDAGFTYGEGVAPDLLRIEDIYAETYLLLAPAALAPRLEREVTWAEASELPLSLLEPGMMNRRIIDQVFAEQGLVPQVVAETSGFVASMELAAQGLAATIAPRILIESFGGLRNTVALPLVEPTLEKQVSLVTPLRDPRLPTVQALRRIVQNA